MSIVPGTTLVLFMERPSGNHPDGNPNFIAGHYDTSNNEFSNVDSTDSLFCCGHTPSASGNVVVVGGHRAQNNWKSGMQSLRIFDRNLRTLTTVSQMRHPRWYPTATLLPNSHVLIMGGTQGVGAGTPSNSFYEIWDPSNPTAATVELPMPPSYQASSKQVRIVRGLGTCCCCGQVQLSCVQWQGSTGNTSSWAMLSGSETKCILPCPQPLPLCHAVMRVYS